ncbi:hypothetical protein EDD15DRAFT_2200059, partial [Pisolithus albus]
STGISITTSCTWMSNFIIGLVSPRMLANIAHGGTCFFFAAFAILAFIPTYFYPETKGKTLEEMDMAFGDVTSEQEEQHMERICGEPGLLSKALLSACHRAMDHTTDVIRVPAKELRLKVSTPDVMAGVFSVVAGVGYDARNGNYTVVN